MYRTAKVIAQLFFDVGVSKTNALIRAMASYEKGLRYLEGLCIHDGGDEGDRTPDLLTASQALSQLSYAPVTGRYYRGRFSLMQGLFWVESRTYGFSWDGAKIITL